MALDRAEILKNIGRWNVSSLPSCQELLNLAFLQDGDGGLKIKAEPSVIGSYLAQVSINIDRLVPERCIKIGKLAPNPSSPNVDNYVYKFPEASPHTSKTECTIRITYTSADRKDITSIERLN